MTNELATSNEIVSAPAIGGVFSTVGSVFEKAQRIATALCQSNLVPKDYQGKDKLPSCLIALEMAERTGASVLTVMQNLVVVHNRPTWSSQFLISTVNSCGRFTALRYEFFGKQGTDDWGCRAWAIEKSTGEKLVGADITIGLAKKEGWYSRNGSKWQTMPQQMMMYRAGSWWTRAYAPELSMGMHTRDEAEDIGMIDVTPANLSSVDDLNKEYLGKTIDGEAAPAAEPKALDKFTESQTTAGDPVPPGPGETEQEHRNAGTSHHGAPTTGDPAPSEEIPTMFRKNRGAA